MPTNVSKIEGTSLINMGICHDMPIWESSASRKSFQQPPPSTAMMQGGEWADLGVQQTLQFSQWVQKGLQFCRYDQKYISYTYTYCIINSHGICAYIIYICMYRHIYVLYRSMYVSNPTLVSTVCMLGPPACVVGLGIAQACESSGRSDTTHTTAVVRAASVLTPEPLMR